LLTCFDVDAHVRVDPDREDLVLVNNFDLIKEVVRDGVKVQLLLNQIKFYFKSCVKKCLKDNQTSFTSISQSSTVKGSSVIEEAIGLV
jgi:hypothetical protein